MSSHCCVTDGPAALADLIWVFRGWLHTAEKCLHLLLLWELVKCGDPSNGTCRWDAFILKNIPMFP